MHLELPTEDDLLSAPPSWWKFIMALIVILASVISYIWIYLSGLPPLVLTIPAATLLAATFWALAQCSATTSIQNLTMAGVAIVVAAAAIPKTAMQDQPGPRPSYQPSWEMSSIKLAVNPAQGPAGSSFSLSASGFQPRETVRIEYYEGPNLKHFNGPYVVDDVPASSIGEVSGEFVINREICCAGGEITIRVTGRQSHNSGRARFLLTR